jgi:agmatinase
MAATITWWTFQLLFLVLPVELLARDIVFPPINPLQVNAVDLAKAPGPDQDQLLEFQKYAGLTTFANLPWVHCLSPEDHIDKYDIAFLGAPFDTATTGRPGTRFGPTGIRL